MSATINQNEINSIVWRACDTFRGAIDPENYKNYILTMLFLKYISDLHKDKKEELESKYGGDNERIERVLRRERFVIPPESDFYYLYENREAPNIGELINIALEKIEDENKEKKKVATLTGFHPRSRYGVVRVNGEGIVNYWQEKPLMNDLTSGGFFVFRRDIFDWLDPDCVLEREPMEKLAKAGELALYPHHGFWFCMDTFKEAQMLNEMWKNGERPWKVWKD